MLLLCFFFLLILLLLFSVLSPIPPLEKVWTKEELVDLATKTARESGLHVPTFLAVIKCESQWDYHVEGDGGDSVGLVQISLPHWPEVTKAQAQDPFFSVNFMANMWKQDRAYLWSCWHIVRSMDS